MATLHAFRPAATARAFDTVRPVMQRAGLATNKPSAAEVQRLVDLLKARDKPGDMAALHKVLTCLLDAPEGPRRETSA